MTLKEALGRVVGRRDLTREEMARIMGQMLAGEATPAQVGAFAVALRMKGETEDEILGAAEAMRACATRIHPKAEVIVRNLVREPLPPICADYAGAVVGHADRADEHFVLSEQLIGELERSHYLIISTPMHNYMVPAALKLWLDYVVRIRRTFEIHNGQRVGLLEDRPTFVVLSSGGHYLGAKAKQMDFLSPYLRHVLGIIGLHHVEYLHLQGLADGEEAVNAALQRLVDDEKVLRHIERLRGSGALDLARVEEARRPRTAR